MICYNACWQLTVTFGGLYSMLYIRPLCSWIHLPLTLSIITSKGTIRLRATFIGSSANNSSACSLVLGKPMNAQTELLHMPYLDKRTQPIEMYMFHLSLFHNFCYWIFSLQGSHLTLLKETNLQTLNMTVYWNFLFYILLFQ